MSKFKVGDRVRVTKDIKNTNIKIGMEFTVRDTRYQYKQFPVLLVEIPTQFAEDELELVPEVYLCDTCGKAKNECPIYPPKTCPECVEYRERKAQPKSESESVFSSETKEITVGFDRESVMSLFKVPSDYPIESVNHPTHYGGEDNTYEAIKVIEAWDLGFCLGNTVKYISRAGKKDPSKTVEDLKKALWYLDREITRIEQNG